MVQVNDLLAKKNRPFFTLELLPPLKGKGIESVFSTVEELLPYEPAYIHMTYHQQEMEYIEHEDGHIEKRYIRKRPGTIAVAAAVQMKYNIPVVPHLICGGFSQNETEDALIDLDFLGIRNVFTLRGDPIPGQKRFIPEKSGHTHASGLVKQICNLNRGKYLAADLKDAHATNFSIGVAGYPEKHDEAPNLQTDLEYLKKKIDAGANYIVSQMFFDNSHFFRFVDRCRNAGIEVPIVPGIKPISSFNDLRFIPRTFHIDIPGELTDRVRNFREKKDVWLAGIEWAIAQSEALIANGFQAIHYFTLGQGKNITKILDAVFTGIAENISN